MRRAFILAVLLVGLVGACGDDDATTTSAPPPATTSVPSTTSVAPPNASTSTTAVDSAVDVAVSVVGETVVVTVDGIPTSGRVDIAIGAEVRLTVAADVEDEVHLHGYDLTDDVVPGTPAVIEFTADIPGIFEVEFEASHRLLVELQVS